MAELFRICRAILGNHCPRCSKGRVFSGLTRMNPACPSCGLRFERENGYFLGAMILSYFAGALAVVPTIVFLRFGLEVPFEQCIGVAMLQVLLTAPFLFRFSRLIWIHFEQFFDPDRT